MQIRCDHGYFFFRESKVGQISAFMSIFGLDLVAKDDYYTFETLFDSDDFSIKGSEYLGSVATVTYAGRPWEVMRENGLVYDFTQDLVVPIETIVTTVEISEAANYFLSPGLILPGSVRDDGSRVTDYSAWYLFDSAKFKYSEVNFE